MTTYEKIIQAIYLAIDDINPFSPEEQRLDKSEDTIIFGDTGKLDSLGIVNFIVTTEQMLEIELGIAITLADEKGLYQDTNPFRSIRDLAEYIMVLLEERTSD